MTVKSRPSGLLTFRDQEILSWLARQRIVNAAHVQERFGLRSSTAYARLRVLANHGLVEHQRIFHGRPGVFRATRAGLAFCGERARPARIDLAAYAHDLDLAALCTELEREFGAERVLTERELRRAEARAQSPRYATAPGANGRRHYPDLAVDGLADDRPLAVELECTRKSAPRLDAILRAYVRARHIAAVRYYATTPGVERALVAAIARVKSPDGFVEVRRRTS